MGRGIYKQKRGSTALTSITDLTMQNHEGERGSVMVEFSIVFGILLFFTFACISFLWVIYNLLAVQWVVAESLRSAAVSYGSGQTTPDSIKDEVLLNAQRLSVSIGNVSISVCPGIQLSCPQSQEGVGTGEGFASVIVRYSIPYFIAIGGTDELELETFGFIRNESPQRVVVGGP